VHLLFYIVQSFLQSSMNLNAIYMWKKALIFIRKISIPILLLVKEEI